MKAAGLVLFLALVPVAGLAQGMIEVRSGEHPGFSRIVAEFPARPDWRLEQANGRARIVFDALSGTFDFRNVFRYIPRTRIAGIRQDGPAIDLDLACLCDVRVFEVREAALVIDVFDGPSLDTVASVSSDADGSAPAAESPGSVPSLLARIEAMAPAPFRKAGDPGVTLPSLSGPERPPPVSRLPEASTSETAPAVSAGPADGAGLTGALARQIGRAATFGLVTPGEARGGARSPVGTGANAADSGLPSNLRIRTPGLDSPAPDAAAPTAERAAPGCPSQAEFDLAAWAPADGDLARALAERRTRLVGELDVVDGRAALDLARLYIAAGFGAEAAQVLTLHAGGESETALLLDLAGVVDGLPGDRPALARVADCPGRAQLWAFLSAGDQDPRINDPEAALVALAELPLGLRRHLAPRVADRLLAAGFADAADGARRLVARAPGPHGAPFDLVSARIDARVGGGAAELADLALGASTVSGDALAEFLELMNERQLPVASNFVALADVQAYAFRNVPLGARLETALIRALLSRDDFGAAFARIERAVREGFIAPDVIAVLSREFVRELSERAPDDVFLVHVLSYLDAGRPAGLGEATATQAARRLLDLGLPDPARAYLDRAGSGEAARLARARYHLLQGAPERTIELTAGMDGTDAQDLIAAALSALGRHREAAPLYDARGEDARATAAFWKAGAWSSVAERAPGTRRAAAELLTRESPASASAGAATQRERIEDVLAESSDARATLDALLADIPRP